MRNIILSPPSNFTKFPPMTTRVFAKTRKDKYLLGTSTYLYVIYMYILNENSLVNSIMLNFHLLTKSNLLK